MGTGFEAETQTPTKRMIHSFRNMTLCSDINS